MTLITYFPYSGCQIPWHFQTSRVFPATQVVIQHGSLTVRSSTTNQYLRKSTEQRTSLSSGKSFFSQKGHCHKPVSSLRTGFATSNRSLLGRRWAIAVTRQIISLPTHANTTYCSICRNLNESAHVSCLIYRHQCQSQWCG